MFSAWVTVRTTPNGGDLQNHFQRRVAEEPSSKKVAPLNQSRGRSGRGQLDQRANEVFALLVCLV